MLHQKGSFYDEQFRNVVWNDYKYIKAMSHLLNFQMYNFKGLPAKDCDIEDDPGTLEGNNTFIFYTRQRNKFMNCDAFKVILLLPVFFRKKASNFKKNK